MSEIAATPAPGQPLTFRPGRWIDGWNPEDPGQWAREGQAIAKRNLGFSIYAEFLGFCVWQLWSIVVVWLGANNSRYGFAFTDSQQFWLISLPSLVGATLRFPYTFMVSKIGGRNWTICSAVLLLIPTVAMSFAIANHPVDGVGGTSYGVMLLVAALGGFGGGNFASSMANITYFYPQRSKGWALGLNAAGGNIGAAVAQFIVPIAVSATAFNVTLNSAGGPERAWNLPIAGYLWIPLILIAIAGAVWGMNNLSAAKSDFEGYKAALKEPHLWLMSLLYIGTFGSFIGLSGAFPKLLADTFPDYSTISLGIVSIGLAFLGPLVGSLARPFGGKLADRLGGAVVTVVAFIVMALATLLVIWTVNTKQSFWLYLVFFLVLFVFTGVGNGSMYRMIPTVMAYRAGQLDARHQSAGVATERKTSACLGIISAFGAYGGFIVPQVFSLSKTSFGSYVPGLWWFLAAYFACLIITIVAYVIPYRRQGISV